MNRYEKASDRLFMWATNGYCALVFNSKEYKDIKAILQELVDRATPRKPIKDSYSISACSNCGCIFLKGKQNYCSECGQALDWGDEQ